MWTCDSCRYYVLLLRPQTWQSRKRLVLLGAKSYKSMFGSEAELQLQQCLSGQRSLSSLPASGTSNLTKSRCHDCVSYLCGQKHCWSPRGLRTQIRSCRIWSNWKCNGLLPLVALALSGPEEASWWLLSQLLRYSFCGICGNELEGLALIAQEQKSLFPCQPILHHLFCYHVYWHGDTQKGHRGCCSSLYDSPLLLRSGLYSGMCIGTSFPQESQLGKHSGKTTLLHLRWHQRKGQIKQRSWWYETKSAWDAIWNAPLVHLHPASVVEPGGTSKMPALVRDRLSPTREEKLWWRVCLHPHLEKGRTLPVEKSHSCGCCFFLSYRWEQAVPEPLL